MLEGAGVNRKMIIKAIKINTMSQSISAAKTGCRLREGKSNERGVGRQNRGVQ